MLPTPLTQERDRLTHDPAVDRRHEVVPLRFREKGVGSQQAPMLVRQAQQNLAPGACRSLRLEWDNPLRVQLKAALVHRPRRPCDPWSLDLLKESGGCLQSLDMDTVASRVLGDIAGGVGSPEHGC